MNRLFNKAARSALKIFGNGLSQEDSIRANEPYDVPDNAKALMRQMAADGVVLLKNDGTLPLSGSIALFGRCQIDWFCCGYGSGGDVNAPYKVNLLDALDKNEKVTLNTIPIDYYKKYIKKHPADEGFWGHWPYSFNEPVPSLDMLKSVACDTETAVMVIGRAAGEDRENKLTKGSYYLTDNEVRLLDMLTKRFMHTVIVLNCGNIIDMRKIYSYGDKISAIVYAFQGGMESGNAVADVLTGKVNPCGHLTDTIAKDYIDYPSAKDFGGREFNNYTEDIFVGYRYFETFSPEKVLYPFGFGLSYTDFNTEKLSFYKADDEISISVKVTNIGTTSGKQVIQLYCEQPDGEIKTAKRILCGFEKTNLLQPDETQIIEFTVSAYAISSYNEQSASYIMQEGEYRFIVSDCVRGGIEVGCFRIENEYTVQKLENVCGVKDDFSSLSGRIKRKDTKLKGRIIERLPKEIEGTENRSKTLADVKNGKISIDEFIAQLDNNELEALTRGDFIMNSPLGASGNAGVFGGILPSLRAKGVPPLTCTDGPAGIRMTVKRSLLPTGVCIAASWNKKLAEKLYSFVSDEMAEAGSDILLAPGMNIHRNPLCGRNFEYFSEDPFVSGKMAASVIRGIQSHGGSACPKHFACNNQEVCRNQNDSRVSERALREIYLKGFEIAVKESQPDCIMTSYNKINSVFSYNNYDLVTTVLRKEWEFDGCVMTDWWVKHTQSPEFPLLHDSAYRVRAQVDVLMPGVNGKSMFAKKKNDGTLFKSVGKEDGITLAEIQRCAKNTLKLCLKHTKD
ncbi:MAG: glycoside hydrolase family 3 C-terminal domain-containing protein [Clostridia bacterium]|nr:glycoside hydrolase family 3 C-terminal domain-containing protein [Clostridia bacterium]